jgi:hypothetical protein
MKGFMMLQVPDISSSLWYIQCDPLKFLCYINLTSQSWPENRDLFELEVQ